MAKPPPSDPTKAPAFQKLVAHFLNTKPQPRIAPKLAAKKRAAKRKGAK